ncbi:MAG: hypothetical protein ACPMAQ_07160 [Phycisphaerae bacterium]
MPGRSAEEAGCSSTICVNVQGKAVTNAAEFRQAMAKQDLKKGVRLLVQRGSTQRFVFVRSGE